MRRSESRVLTTHAGSLPRSPALVDMLVRVSKRDPVDAGALAREVETSTRHVVTRQLAAGVDVGNDGEQPRESFLTYLQHRMSGFGGTSDRPIMRDIVQFQSFLALKLPEFSRTMVSLMNAPQAIGPVAYTDSAPVERECADFARILAGERPGFVETFMTAASPGIVAAAMTNAHYRSTDEYVLALADALAVEYRAIVGHGHVLQLDCPDLAMERHTAFADRPLGDFLRWVELNVGAINRALAGIDPARVRMHVCWGNYEAPHTLDVPLEALLPLLYEARVGGTRTSIAVSPVCRCRRTCCWWPA
jgi:5-methyltetrahydropteroyltriglutamate--homocysteine methyltransferase